MSCYQKASRPCVNLQPHSLPCWRTGPKPWHKLSGRAHVTTKATKEETRSLSLADIISFESQKSLTPSELEFSPEAKADEIINKAERLLKATRDLLGDDEDVFNEQPAPRPSLTIRVPSSAPDSARFGAEGVTRAVLHQALAKEGGSSKGPAAATQSSPTGQPAWAQRLFDGAGPQLQLAPQQQQSQEQSPFEFAERVFAPAFLELKSQEEEFAAKARTATLPPLQSMLDLTTAYKAPSKTGEMTQEEAEAAAQTQGRQLPDGKGVLADGTKWEKKSGQERTPDGVWKRWTILKGSAEDDAVEWEETWWETSDRYGLRELGATKRGSSADGAKWHETWTEKAYPHPEKLRMVIERSAHKWSQQADGNEWEERWHEYYEEFGRVTKTADKWAKSGSQVWHERWGEDYDGRGACQKYTDKWAECVVPGGARQQWGDKWTETFGNGSGTKHGEVWSVDPSGHRYNRWWNEEHHGNGYVRKYGNSTSGEYWDTTERMDTYYNPIPHFGFKHALQHSPTLMSVKLPEPGPVSIDTDDDTGGLGLGIGAL